MTNNGKGACKTRLCPISLGLTLGITFGLCKMLFAWSAAIWGIGGGVVDLYASFYYGYGPSIMGGFVGGLWGLIIGFIFGAFIGFLYNYISCYCNAKSCCGKNTEGGGSSCCK